jgi:uncharacterized protein (TIGR03118 family)
MRARVLGLFFVAVCCAVLLVSQASAQYSRTLLVSDVPIALHTDANLVDGWGLAALPGSPWWVSNQNTSTSSLFTANGSIVPLLVQIPCILNGEPTVPCPVPGLFPLAPPFGPTGIVANTFAFGPTPTFSVKQNDKSGSSLFIFDTLDGLIVGWNPNVNLTQAVVAASESGAAYTGLAIWGPASDPHLYAANSNGGIDVFDTSFTKVNTFAADSEPGTFTPYGIQTIGNWLFVTYSSPVGGGGIIDRCELTASATMPPCRRLAANLKAPFWLNGPWGLAWAPNNFGPLSGDLLVGNVNTGLIAALDPVKGSFKSWLRLKNGELFAIRGLWALEFGLGAEADGHTNQLFFTAGPAAKDKPIFSEGLYGVLNPPPAQP